VDVVSLERGPRVIHLAPSKPSDANLLRYFMSPFSVVLWVTALICDLLYPFVFAEIRKSEKMLPDGRKVAGDSVNSDKKRVSFDKGK
jgi:hypothetical protein